MWVVLNLPTQQSNHHASIAPWANYDMVAENKNAPANSILLAKGGGGSEEEEEQQKQVQNILVLPCCHSTSPAPCCLRRRTGSQVISFPCSFLMSHLSPSTPGGHNVVHTTLTYTLRTLCERNRFSKRHQQHGVFLARQLLPEPQVLFVVLLRKCSELRHNTASEQQLNPILPLEWQRIIRSPLSWILITSPKSIKWTFNVAQLMQKSCPRQRNDNLHNFATTDRQTQKCVE